MKRKVLAVAFPLVLAGVVGCGSKDVSEDKKTDSLKVSESKKLEDSSVKLEKEYKSKLKPLLADFIKDSQEINLILSTDKPAVERGTEFEKRSKNVLELDAKVNSLNPGNKYREVHNKITDTMLSAKSGFITIRNGLNINDESLVNEGKDAIDKAIKQLVEEENKLKEEK
ncbi:hypothetical protein [Bacillus sp. BP-3]|uniref:hypothetical protein n=1 Tax=Bacillus sp. BP-3 TaxID=3022773 RepID=UPI00233150F3|nr:hypothetical protein [Bacillus sp. BP-3]MDC2864386.1 hypothetical protein [Bacillus sp. BP-3]